jgi:hypothetical protein
MHDPLIHHFMGAEVQLRRLLQIHEEHGGLTVAVDFDNTLFDFHHEKEKHVRGEYDFSEIYSLLLRLRHAGCYIIIWTANEDDEFIKRFCAERNIPYDAINENPPFFKSECRKIYYNVLLDDAAGLRETYFLLCQFLEALPKPNRGAQP